MRRSPLAWLAEKIPLGVLVILILAAVSALYIFTQPPSDLEGRLLWTFIRDRVPVYREVIEDWDLRGEEHMSVELVEYRALQRRLLSGFVSGMPLADIVEVERNIASATWRGPLEAVGFVDLTEHLKKDGIYEMINEPSYSPWTNRGRIFGLPADVHPVLLAYRADIFEAEGIDVSELTTWEKFFDATRHLVQDFTGDGTPDQYIFELPETDGAIVVTLIFQAGGRLFDEEGRPVLNSAINVRTLATLADWASEPGKVTGDLDLYTGAGNQLRSQGFVLSWLVPDWRARIAENYIQAVSGKMKLMPLPAFEEGGRRTSSWGGTMLGFPKSAGNFEKNWEFAKRLYLSRELVRLSWTEFSVLTPVKQFWDDPIFDQPHPYWSNQLKGQIFISQAGSVPVRDSSPYNELATREVSIVMNALVRHAEANGLTEPEDLMPEAEALLDRAQANVVRQMKRNIFSPMANEDSAP